jgi:hypothetical protein
MYDLLAEIEAAIRANCFCDERSDEVGGIDFAAEAVLAIVQREAQYSASSAALEASRMS